MAFVVNKENGQNGGVPWGEPIGGALLGRTDAGFSVSRG